MRGNNALRNIERVLNTRDMEQLNKTGYYHLTMACGFIAHYSIDGFKGYFAERFNLFLRELWDYLQWQKQCGHFTRATSFLRDFPYTDMTKLKVQLELYGFIEKNIERLRERRRVTPNKQETLF